MTIVVIAVTIIIIIISIIIIIIIIISVIIIVSEALFCLCRGTYISTLFGVCSTFRSRTTAVIIFFLF